MLGKLFRFIFTVFGIVLGYGTCLLLAWILRKTHVDLDSVFPGNQGLMVEIGIAIIFGIIFFKIEPALVHQSKRLSDRINQDMQDVSSSMLVSGTLGLIAGLIVAYLVSRMFFIITNRYIYGVVVVLTYGFFCYLGVLIGTSKRNELPNIRQPKQTGKPDAAAVGRVSGRKKGAQQPVPKILDTSVIIDGRIAEILKTGFLEGPIIIPDYVLVELRHIADSSDSLKRVRGRRGLDILKMIQDDYGVEIYNTENEKLLKEIPEVDVKLLKLAQIMNGKVVTNDYNLNKVAGINGVGVLNINELANCLKPVVLPGEEMTVDLVKQGKDPGQGVGYLDDGTMIVVENGRRMIGKTAKIKVTSVFQTSAGRMIFGRLK